MRWEASHLLITDTWALPIVILFFLSFYFPGVCDNAPLPYIILQIIYFGRPWNVVYLTTWKDPVSSVSACHRPHSISLPAGLRPVPSLILPVEGSSQAVPAGWPGRSRTPCLGLTIDKLFPDNLCLSDTLPATFWRESGLSRS